MKQNFYFLKFFLLLVFLKGSLKEANAECNYPIFRADIIDKAAYNIIHNTPNGTPFYDTKFWALIDWDPVLDGLHDGYHVWYRKSGTSDWTKKVTATSSLKIYELTPNTDYECRVRVKRDCQTGGWTPIIKFKTESPSCLLEAPTGLKAMTDRIGTFTALIQWNTVFGSSYEIAYKKASDQMYKRFLTNERTFFITDLEPSTEYTLRIRSKCTSSGAFSLWSTPSRFTSNGCNAPNLFSRKEDGIVRLIWYDSYYDVDNDTYDGVRFRGALYQFKYKKVGSSDEVWGYTSLGYDVLRDEQLLPGTTYEYKVKRNCPDGEWTRITFRTANSAERIGINEDNENNSSNPIIGGEDKLFIKVMDLNGKPYSAQSEKVWGNNYDLAKSVKDLPGGIYLIEVKSKKERCVKKIMKVSGN